MPLNLKQLAQLRKQGYSEAEIAQLQSSGQPASQQFHRTDTTPEQQRKAALDQATGEAYGPPMGTARNVPLDPSTFSPARPGSSSVTPEARELAAQQGVSGIYASVDDMQAGLYPGVNADREEAMRQLNGFDSTVTPAMMPSDPATGIGGPGGGLMPIEQASLDRLRAEEQVNRILAGIDLEHTLGTPLGSFFSGAASSKNPRYSGGLQQIAAMFGSGAEAAQEMMLDNNRMRTQMAFTRAGIYGRTADRASAREGRLAMAEQTSRYRTQLQEFSREKFDESKRQFEKKQAYTAGQDTLDRQEDAAAATGFRGYKDRAQYNTSANALRDDLDKQIKGFNVINGRYAKMSDIKARRDGYNDWSGAEDLSMVFSVMKAEDPTSTVREGEAATAANAGSSWDTKLGQLYNQMLLGKTVLSPKARQEHFENMNATYGNERKKAVKTRMDYGGRAKRAGIFAGDIMGSEAWREAEEITTKGATGDTLKYYEKLAKAGVKPDDSLAEISRKMKAAGFE